MKKIKAFVEKLKAAPWIEIISAGSIILVAFIGFTRADQSSDQWSWADIGVIGLLVLVGMPALFPRLYKLYTGEESVARYKELTRGVGTIGVAAYVFAKHFNFSGWEAFIFVATIVFGMLTLLNLPRDK